MKKFNVGLAVVAAMSLYGSANAQSLAEALTNGKVSGEFTATYETKDFDKNVSTYYQGTGYSVGSFALKYETGAWNNLSLTSKFRAYATLFEEDNDLSTLKGTGDASERFWEKDNLDRDVDRNADIEELFLTYAPTSNITVKAGRQFISSHWINKTQDAVKIDAAFGDTSLEAIWSVRQGRIYSRDYRPMTKMNKNKGVYQIALSHKFNDNISATVYDAIAPDKRDIYGAKVNGKIGTVSLGAHYAESKEDKSTGNDDSNLMHFTASTSIAGFSPYAGYIKVDNDAAFPGWAGIAGETIDPMEEGDYIYKKGAETIYLGVTKSIYDVSATLLYGQTEWDNGTKDVDMNETTLWLGYPVTKNLKANLGYTVVNMGADTGAEDYNQLNFTLAYSF